MLDKIKEHELFTSYIVSCERLEWATRTLASSKDYVDSFDLDRLTRQVTNYNLERSMAHEELLKALGCRRDGVGECRICPVGMCLRFNLAIIIEKHFGRYV